VTPDLFGAIVTAPISLRPQRGGPQPRLVELPGGFLLATGDPNLGLRRVLQEHAAGWGRLGVPVLVALAGSAPKDWDEMAARLDEEPAMAGIELPLAEDLRPADARNLLSAVRQATTLPLLVKLPVTRASDLAEACLAAGADALVVGIPPMAASPAPDGTIVAAPAAGPIAFPFTLQALRQVAMLGLDVPLVAAGGIHAPDDVKLCLAAGAAAVQVRSLLWTDPVAAVRLAEAVRTFAPWENDQ
jgi:dihydroorotate dehydrogenase (NAD+) catalytic subunit